MHLALTHCHGERKVSKFRLLRKVSYQVIQRKVTINWNWNLRPEFPKVLRVSIEFRQSPFLGKNTDAFPVPQIDPRKSVNFTET